MKKFFVIFIAVLLLTGCGVSVEKSSAPVLDFGMTFEQFKTKYNATINENFPSTGWDISTATLKSGDDKDWFSYRFNDKVALMGAADKDSGMMKEFVVTWILQADEAGRAKVVDDDLAKAMAAYVSLMLMLSPELTVEQRGEVLRELKLSGDDILDLINENDGVAIRGNVEYRSTFVADGGFFQFIVSAKDTD